MLAEKGRALGGLLQKDRLAKELVGQAHAVDGAALDDDPLIAFAIAAPIALKAGP